MSSSQPITPQSLRTVRLAIVAGVLMLGAVAWFLTQQNPPDGFDAADTLQLAFLVLSLGALGTVLFIRRLWQNAETFQRKATLSIVALAIGEAPALLGGVYYILSGDFTLYLGGLLVLFVPFFLFPVPPTSGASTP